MSLEPNHPGTPSPSADGPYFYLGTQQPAAQAFAPAPEGSYGPSHGDLDRLGVFLTTSVLTAARDASQEYLYQYLSNLSEHRVQALGEDQGLTDGEGELFDDAQERISDSRPNAIDADGALRIEPKGTLYQLRVKPRNALTRSDLADKFVMANYSEFRDAIVAAKVSGHDCLILTDVFDDFPLRPPECRGDLYVVFDPAIIEIVRTFEGGAGPMPGGESIADEVDEPEKFMPYGPTGIPLMPEPCDTREEAQRILDGYCKAIDRQGHFRDMGFTIPASEVRGMCRIEMVSAAEEPEDAIARDPAPAQLVTALVTLARRLVAEARETHGSETAADRGRAEQPYQGLANALADYLPDRAGEAVDYYSALRIANSCDAVHDLTPDKLRMNSWGIGKKVVADVRQAYGEAARRYASAGRQNGRTI